MTNSKSVEKQINENFEALHLLPEQVQRASIFSMNHTADWMKSQLAKDISNERNVTVKLLKGRIGIERANKRK